MIRAYRECVPKLAEATLRAEVESQIMKIASGEKDHEDVRQFVLKAFKGQFKTFMNNFHKFAKNFESKFFFFVSFGILTYLFFSLFRIENG